MPKLKTSLFGSLNACPNTLRFAGNGTYCCAVGSVDLDGSTPSMNLPKLVLDAMDKRLHRLGIRDQPVVDDAGWKALALVSMRSKGSDGGARCPLLHQGGRGLVLFVCPRSGHGRVAAISTNTPRSIANDPLTNNNACPALSPVPRGAVR